MSTAQQDWHARVLDLEHKLIDAHNLVAALQQIAWCLTQQTETDPERRRNRDAVIGIAEALEKVLKYPDELHVGP